MTKHPTSRADRLALRKKEFEKTKTEENRESRVRRKLYRERTKDQETLDALRHPLS